MVSFIDDHRDVYGVEPICRVLPIAPSTYHAHAARRLDPSAAPPRVRRDEELRHTIRRVFDENFRVLPVNRLGTLTPDRRPTLTPCFRVEGCRLPFVTAVVSGMSAVS